MIKHTSKYSAAEMANTIHRAAIKAAIRQAYCEEMAEYHMNDWQVYDEWQNQAHEHEKEYSIIEELAFQAGTIITYREKSIAFIVGTTAAKMDHVKEA